MKYERQSASPEVAGQPADYTPFWPPVGSCEFSGGYGFLLVPELVGENMRNAGGVDWPVFIRTALGNLSVPGAFPCRVEIYRNGLRLDSVRFIDRPQLVRFDSPYERIRVYSLMPWADHAIYAMERWGCWILEDPGESIDCVRSSPQFRRLMRQTVPQPLPVYGGPPGGLGIPLRPGMVSLTFAFFNGPRDRPGTQAGEQVDIWYQTADECAQALGGTKVDKVDTANEQVATRAVFAPGGILWLTSPSGTNDVDIFATWEV